MKLLSIDWDFFFPDSMPYDWGHNETFFFLTDAWGMFRTDSHNQVTGEPALDAYAPTIPRQFWSRVLDKNMPSALFTAESHATIMSVIKGLRSLSPKLVTSITHLDAHHDHGYENKSPSLDCGNWAAKAQAMGIEVNLYYPEWRKALAEAKPDVKPTSIHYGLPDPDKYLNVFVCRSGCWTPPWYDDCFKRFIASSGLNAQAQDEYVNMNRGLTLKQARKMQTCNIGRTTHAHSIQK